MITPARLRAAMKVASETVLRRDPEAVRYFADCERIGLTASQALVELLITLADRN